MPQQNVGQGRAYSYPQIVFLLAVAKLEMMRAELGDPSEMLNYFHNEGVNSGSLAQPLHEIAHKVSIDLRLCRREYLY